MNMNRLFMAEANICYSRAIPRRGGVTD